MIVADAEELDLFPPFDATVVLVRMPVCSDPPIRRSFWLGVLIEVVSTVAQFAVGQTPVSTSVELHTTAGTSVMLAI